jgi:hypothetical protein
MYLASTPSHLPLAVFDHFADAEAYLCSLENVSLRFACVDRLNLKSEIHKVYTEAYGEFPEKILGYIMPGVQINPNYVVR